jgi:hypothetical protein
MWLCHAGLEHCCISSRYCRTNMQDQQHRHLDAPGVGGDCGAATWRALACNIAAVLGVTLGLAIRLLVAKHSNSDYWPDMINHESCWILDGPTRHRWLLDLQRASSELRCLEVLVRQLLPDHVTCTAFVTWLPTR